MCRRELLAQTSLNKGRHFILSGDDEVLGSVERRQLLYSHQTDSCLKHVLLSLCIIRHHTMTTHQRLESVEIVSLAVFIVILSTYLICLSCGPSRRSFLTFLKYICFCRRGVFSPPLNPQIFGCMRLLSQYTRMYRSSLETSTASATREHDIPW
jgi:hypothetical protein